MPSAVMTAVMYNVCGGLGECGVMGWIEVNIVTVTCLSVSFSGVGDADVDE